MAGLNIYDSLSPLQIQEGGYDQRQALIDSEICRVSEEENVGYEKAYAIVVSRYQSMDLVPTTESYDAVSDVTDFIPNHTPVVYSSNSGLALLDGLGDDEY